MGMQSKVRTAATELVSTRSDCRLCHGNYLTKIWSFGPTPLANAYLTPKQIGQPEPLLPLDVYFCRTCHLVQLKDVVAPELLFANYLYVSSTSPTFVRHFEDYAHYLTERFRLNSTSLVVDIGSNDGVLLKPLQQQGIRVLGIEPAQNIANLANHDGVETVAEFFTPPLARQLANEKGKAAVITANNVFAHTDTIDEFVIAIKNLLAPGGIFVFEVQYLADLLTKNLFDIVYHEHLCYYHIHPLVSFFQRHDMEVFDVQHQPAHGGSVRVFVQRANGPHQKSKRLVDIIETEIGQGLTSIASLQAFASRIHDNRKKLLTILNQLKEQDQRIVGYGAPAKATTLMYALDIGADTVEYIVDDDAKIKQGLLMPGTHIPIVSPARLYEDKPDYCLILAWNFAEPIMSNHHRFTEQGGKFIIPVPEPRIV
jgi:SAM-dependent methyltransferase